MPALTKVQTGFIEPQGAFPIDTGTEAAPGLKFSDSAATGIFSPSTGVLGISTGGTERLRIASDGDIEYKYDDADTSVEVGATQIPHGLRIYNTNNTLGRLAGIHFSHGLGGTANAGIFHETTNTASGSTTCLGDLVFYTKNSGVSHMTEKVRLTSDGYARLTTANARLEWTASSGSNPFIRSIGSGQQELEFNTGGDERLRIASDGKVFIGSATEYGPSAQQLSNKGLIVTSDGENSLKIVDTTAYAANVGASIVLGGNYRSTGDTQAFVRLKAFKENSTDANYDYGFSISTTPNNGSFEERFRITSGGELVSTNGTLRREIETSSFAVSGGTASNSGANINLYGSNHSGLANVFRVRTGSTERFRIHSTGVPQFTTTGTQYVSASVPAFVVNSSGDHALVLNNQNTTDPRGLFIYQDQDVNNGTSYFWRARAGSSDKAHLYTNGNLVLAGSASAKDGVTLTDTDTSARLNVQTDLSGNYTGWKERNVAAGSMSQTSIDSKTPTINDFTYPNSSNGMLIWSTSKIGFAAGSESPQYGTGVQMLFDSNGLILGGNRAFDRTTSTSTNTDYTVRLKTNGTGTFKNSLYANPLQLTSSDSWIKSAYGAISNGTVSSLNNLLIGQNMRGYISGLDGGSANNNYYSIVTYGAGSLGHAGTEYSYGGVTKFYNDTAASTANVAFTPTVSMQINGNGHVTKPKNPSFAVTWNGSSVSVSANSQMQFNNVIHNVGSHYSTSTYRFTAPVAGSYQINFYSIWYHQTLTNAAVYLYKNNARMYGGDIHFSADFSSNKWHNVSYSMVLYLNSGDYIYLQNGSVAITYHGSNWSRFSGYLLG